jgi:hypothetical protein
MTANGEECLRTRGDEQAAGRRLWELPRVLEVRAEQVRYPEPRVYYVGQERREAREAVELLVRTAMELPARALSPALYVGETPVVEYETAGDRLYRFFAYEPEQLQPGAPISLGWPRRPRRRMATGFSYQPAPRPVA